MKEKQHIESMDSATPVEAYVGRMVKELLKHGGEVRIDLANYGECLRFVYSVNLGHGVGFMKDIKEIDYQVRPLNAANWDSENILNKWKAHDRKVT